MLLRLACVFLAFLTASACVARQHPSAAPSPPPDPALATLDELTWGMTQQQVQDLYPGAHGNDNYLALEAVIEGLSALQGFVFTEQRLTGVMVHFQSKHHDRSAYLRDYDQLKRALTDRHGHPTKHSTEWTDDFYKNQPEQYGFALELGHMSKRAAWKSRDTLIDLYVVGRNKEITLTLMYQSLAAAGPTQPH